MFPRLHNYLDNSLDTSELGKGPLNVLEVDLSSSEGAATGLGSNGIGVAKAAAIEVGESSIDIVLLGTDLRSEVLRVTDFIDTEKEKKIKSFATHLGKIKIEELPDPANLFALLAKIAISASHAIMSYNS